MRMAVLGLLFATAVFAGASYYPFAQNSGGGTGYVSGALQYTDVWGINDLGFTYPCTSSSLPFGNGMIASLYMTVDTTAAKGQYYVGTIPDGDDIYVDIT